MRRFGKWVTVFAVTVLTLGALPASLGSTVAGAAASDIKVALFYDSTYGDLSPGGGGESFNLKGSLDTAGYTVSTFSGITTAEWTAGLAGAQVLAIPELQTSGLETALEPGAITAIHDFVNAGGRLMMFDRSSRTAPFLNAVFGFSVAAGTSGSCPCTLDATAATGTEFAGGAATLPNMDATEALSIASLPTGSKAIYVSDGTVDDSVVTLIPFGAGSIVHLAWDWFFNDTETANFPIWTGVLVAGVNAAAPAPPPPAPEPTPEPLPAFTG